MPAPDRLRDELHFHDVQARLRAASLADGDLRFEDDTYLDHESWIRPALAQLGDVAGRRVLDLGCGHGMAAIVLARRGGRVTGLDLSGGYLAEVACRGRANGVDLNLVQGDGARLPFADGSFERIWGNAVLHHLDVGAAAREIARILTPGGVAVFCEPWGDNPLLALARHWLPYPGKQRTADEQPLNGRHLPVLRRSFPELRIEGCQLLAMVGRGLRRGRSSPSLLRWDDRLLRTFPGLWRYCRYAVITLPRPPYND